MIPKLFEMTKGVGGREQNLSLIQGLITWSWIISSSLGSDPEALSWPETGDTQKNLVHDGDRETSGFLGVSIGSTSGYFDGTLRATFASPRNITRIYVKGNAAREEGNASGSRILSFNVDGNQIDAVATAQGSPSILDNSTGWNNVTTVDMRLYANYSRPSGGGFAYGVYYEFEIYGFA